MNQPSNASNQVTKQPSYRQSIITKFIPATNRRPSRVKAIASGGESHTSSYHNLDGNEEQRHFAVARSLAEKLDWSGRLVGGATKTGFVFVFAD